MKKLFLLLFAFSLFGFAQMQNQPAAKPGAQAPSAAAPQTPNAVLDRRWSGVEKQFTDLADAMPEDKFSFVPTAGDFKTVRNFGEQVRHVAASNYLYGAAMMGEKPPVDTGGESGPENLKTKAEIMKYLKDSFAYVYRATDGTTESNLLAPIKPPFGNQMTNRLALATAVMTHVYDHYGQLVVYLRMNSIIPPASRPRR
jgi:uncharacterized damage-inducible protein DinB